MKTNLKNMLLRRGWFLRKVQGLPWGADLQIDWLRLNLPSPGVIFDVGAHRGESVERFSKIFPSARFFCFEPVGANYKILNDRFGSAAHVKCLKLAFGDSCRESYIQLGDDSQTHSLKTTPTASSGSKERVRITTIDNFMRQVGVAKIEFLKIDTEGYELKVLKGASSALANQRITTIFCEATLNTADPIHSSLSDLCGYLNPLGYDLLATYDQAVWSSPPRSAYFNALFIFSGALQKPRY